MTELLASLVRQGRGGLGDLPARLRAEDCTIAYMGASVTAQRDGYRPRLHELICRDTRRDHRAVAAALGATGAITGVFLMDDLVLAHHPDLAFVEYATSDVAGTTPLAAARSRCSRGSSRSCATWAANHASSTSTEATSIVGASEVVAAYEDVADHHAVASINVADWMRTEIERGRLERPTILRDVVHTTDTGSTSDRRGDPPRARADPRGAAGLRAGAPSATIVRRTRIEAPTAAHAGGGPFTKGRFHLVCPYLEIDRDGELRFTPDGDLVGLLVVLGPHSGYIEVSAAGETVDYLLWDDECSYERLGSVVLEPVRPGGDPR